MPAKRKKERVICQFFSWLIGERGGIYVADGRSNAVNVGRHSLATRDRDEALQRLNRLDAVKAVEHDLAPRTILEKSETATLSLEDGTDLYLRHAARAPILGGASAGTTKRYRAVFDKFLPFAQKHGIRHWQEVSKQTLESYGTWLDNHDYDYATEYLELTTLKQIVKWLVAEKRLPANCLITLRLKKPRGSRTYCFRPLEVQAMLLRCWDDAKLTWLGDVILALATTGLRIAELAELRWSDVDLQGRTISLTDTRFSTNKAGRESGRTTKSHHGRVLPIHPDLQSRLENLTQHADGRVYHGPLGGRLKPDTVRTTLIREVLTPLAEQFPRVAGDKGFQDGRLHSLRHYFCSTSANSGVAEQVLMSWLGHRDSRMLRHYFHLHQDEAQRQMAKIDFVGDTVSNHISKNGRSSPTDSDGRRRSKRRRRKPRDNGNGTKSG
jgi:site-specific recombinase XerD